MGIKQPSADYVIVIGKSCVCNLIITDNSLWNTVGYKECKNIKITHTYFYTFCNPTPKIGIYISYSQIFLEM